MNCKTAIIRSGFDQKKCFVHARSICWEEKGITTAQYLDISGCDLFSGILMSTSYDGGKTWSEFKEQNGLVPIECEKNIRVGCDATPMLHKKTGKILLLGHTADYAKNRKEPTGNERYTFYSVYDETENTFSKIKFVDMPEGFENCGNGCGQSVELENGDLLIPVYYIIEDEKRKMFSAVMRCSFDGENITFKELGNTIETTGNIELCEPSLYFFNGKYYLTLRSAAAGYYAVSEDGLSYSGADIWRWDTDEVLPTYNTQQHWLECDGKLFLVYTRKAGNNDHVFRHRAPLFMAEVDTEKMRILRKTERIVVPERGARLGNFGVSQITDNKAIITAAEWMQCWPKDWRECVKHGSDNSIFITTIEE